MKIINSIGASGLSLTKAPMRELTTEEESALRGLRANIAERNAFMAECILFGSEVAAKVGNGDIANALLREIENGPTP